MCERERKEDAAVKEKNFVCSPIEHIFSFMVKNT